MRRRFHFLAALTLVGCSIATAPEPVTTPEPPVATESVRLPGFPHLYDNVAAQPMPTGDIEPLVPFTGDEATVRAQGLPMDTPFELWLVPTHIVFRSGLPHPRQAGGVKLGEAASDRDGKLSFTFRMEESYPNNSGTERGKCGIWLVYPDGKTLAPAFVSWTAGNPTTFQGTVFDEQGRRAPAGTRVKLTVTDMHRGNDTIYFEQETRAVNGEYRFERVPAPAHAIIEAVLPSGISRKREDGEGGMQIKWGCCNGDDYLDNYGAPLTYNFGGPATDGDPWAPAYFLSDRLADPAFAWTSVSGQVFDQAGNLIPDSANAIVIIGGAELPSHASFDAKIPVRSGRYSSRVPVGLVSFDLRVAPGVHVLIEPRPPEIILPQAVTGRPHVVNFGGPASEADPEAPKFAFPSPQPVFTGPSPFIPG